MGSGTEVGSGTGVGSGAGGSGTGAGVLANGLKCTRLGVTGGGSVGTGV